MFIYKEGKYRMRTCVLAIALKCQGPIKVIACSLDRPNVFAQGPKSRGLEVLHERDKESLVKGTGSLLLFVYVRVCVCVCVHSRVFH